MKDLMLRLKKLLIDAVQKSPVESLLLSGGLDSAVTLYIARQQGLECSCLIFDYGQRHRREIESAKAIAKSANCRRADFGR